MGRDKGVGRESRKGGRVGREGGKEGERAWGSSGG